MPRLVAAALGVAAVVIIGGCGGASEGGEARAGGSQGPAVDVPTEAFSDATVPVDAFTGDDDVSIPERTTTTSSTTTTSTTQPPTTTTVPPPILPGDALFEYDDDTLKPAATRELERVARDVRRWAPNAGIVIVGHTDSRGSADYNLALSLRRAEAVRQWFIQHDFLPRRLVARGAGESQLLVPDVDATGNFIEAAGARNRRVEFEPND